MRLLIDTHVLIWWVKDASLISSKVREILADEQNIITVSAVSAWEIATKVRIGKLSFPQGFLDTFNVSVRALGFESLDITSVHAVTGAQLAGRHKDPFDRLLAGQAKCEALTLVSADPAFKQLGIEVIW